ncbi:MAG: hypothetical protein JSS30_04950 [Verrucomicrobia bacterium]|nr:hypothetical protein [Verrucomicrobiota bacterium]
MKRLFFFLLFCTISLSANPFTGFFDSVDRGDLDKVMEFLEKMKPKIEPLPYFRTATRGLVTAIEWKFRQDISRDVAYERALVEIGRGELTAQNKEELSDIIEYLAEDPESLWQKSKNLFKKKKKKEIPPFRIEAVEIYFGALLSQVTWVPASNFGVKMMTDGVKRAKT